MLAARALLRRQPLRIAPLIRSNATLSAAASGAATSTTPPSAVPPTPKPASVKPAASSPSLSKTAVQARSNTSASGSATSKSKSGGASKVASADNASGNAAKKAARKSRKRRKNSKGAAFTRALRARRTRWRPPLAPGTLPVYDLALRYIARDAAKLRIELGNARRELAALEKARVEQENEEAKSSVNAVKEEELEQLREKVRVLEVQSEINRPVVRWMAFRGRADLKRPVYRHLLEQRWRKYGTLDLLMERIHQMNVVPDVLPALHPSVDLQIAFAEAPPRNVVARTRRARKLKTVEPGVYLLPEQTRRPPRMTVTVFHPETRYYTLLLVDPDVPDPESRGFTTYLHWMQPNIALRAGKTVLQPHPHTGYIPPHPQRGSPYHRYTLLLLPHGDKDGPIRVPHVADDARRGFDVRAFCAEHGLDASQGGGAHMWRSVWDGTVSDIYKHTLKEEEPWYVQPSKLAAKEERSSRNRVEYAE